MRRIAEGPKSIGQRRAAPGSTKQRASKQRGAAKQRPCGISIAVGRRVVWMLGQGRSPTRIASLVELHRATVYRIKNGRNGRPHWIHAELDKAQARCRCGALLVQEGDCLACRLRD